MGLPRVRFTVRRMMVITATLAVSWALFFGIAHLLVYRQNLKNEQYYREGAAILEAKKSDVLAAEWRKFAEDAARMNHDSWSKVVTLVGLVGAGVISTGLGLVLRKRSKSVSSPRAEPVNILVSACSTVTKILMVALVLAAISYVGFMLLVMAVDD
jgi:hypothetical protein